MTPICWVLTDGRIGTDNNSLGLAERLGYPYEIKRVHLSGLSRWIAPWVRWFVGRDLAATPALQAPWPDVVISAGRTPAVAALYVKYQSKGKTKCVHITSPGVSPRHFDLLVAPHHDRMDGPTVHHITGALHRVTPEKLEAARAVWSPVWAKHPRPWIALLVGGDTKGLTLTPAHLEDAVCVLRRHYPAATVLATASRRTSPAARAMLKASADYLWDGTGDNPYMGLLACADVLVVTAESVSMVCEACSTGKPVLMVPLSGKNEKLARFQASIVEGGYATWLTAYKAGQGPAAVLDDAAAIVARVTSWFNGRTP